MKMSAKHPDKKALELLAREFVMAATSMSPGTMGLVPGRPTPSPLVRVFSCCIPKSDVPVRIVDAQTSPEGEAVSIALEGGFEGSASDAVVPVASEPCDGPTVRVPLVKLCWGRSGDKGDTANIGIIARRSEYLPFVRSVLTEEAVAGWFAHAVEGEVTRFDLPGIDGMNFVMTRALGGGGTTTLRTDSLAKAFAQQLLAMPIDAPAKWFEGECN